MPVQAQAFVIEIDDWAVGLALEETIGVRFIATEREALPFHRRLFACVDDLQAFIHRALRGVSPFRPR